MTPSYRIADNCIYRTIDGEVVVIQADTGVFYHFSRSCEAFLDFFAEPASLEEFRALFGIYSESESAYLDEFVESLVAKKIVVPVPSEEGSKPMTRISAKTYTRPSFLRTGEKRLDEILVLGT